MAALTVEIEGKLFPAVGRAPVRHVLGKLRLHLETGERVALVGPSGCGKTTLLNIVARLDRDFTGEIRTDGPGRLAYVFQEPRLLPWRSVADNLHLVLAEDPGNDARVQSALREVGLEAAGNVFASRLSLGMARRAALARAFVTTPALLLLDEPFASLDAATAHRLRLLLLDLLERHRTTALLVTHTLDEAVMLADRIVVLGGEPARVLADLAVRLAPGERRSAAAVGAVHARLQAETPVLRGLLPDPATEPLERAAS